MKKFAIAALINLALAGMSASLAKAAPATCTFETCLAYCKKVGGVQCAMYCTKEIPKREAAGICKNGKQVK